jgi:hypothetical protein
MACFKNSDIGEFQFQITECEVVIWIKVKRPFLNMGWEILTNLLANQFSFKYNFCMTAFSEV